MEKITPETLKGWLDDPKVFLMDVRGSAEWDASRVKIKHAHYFAPSQLSPASIKDIPPDSPIVLYCS